MTSLECHICGGNDGMRMYGVIVCKAALAKANAEKAEWQKKQEAESFEVAQLRRDLAAAIARADKYSAWWEKAATETQEARFLEVQQMARADKAERDLGECLAATNEVLKDALEQGKEADAPNQALVKAVRAAYRLGAEEMRERSVTAMRRAVPNLERNSAYRDFRTNAELIIEEVEELELLPDGDS